MDKFLLADGHQPYVREWGGAHISVDNYEKVVFERINPGRRWELCDLMKGLVSSKNTEIIVSEWSPIDQLRVKLRGKNVIFFYIYFIFVIFHHI